MYEREHLSLPSPPNIYGLASVEHQGSREILIASKSQVFTLFRYETDGNQSHRSLFSLEMVRESTRSMRIIGLDAYNVLRMLPHSPKTPYSSVSPKTLRAASFSASRGITSSGTTSSGGSGKGLRPGQGVIVVFATSQLQLSGQNARVKTRVHKRELGGNRELSSPKRNSIYILNIFGGCSTSEDDWSHISNDKQLITLSYLPFIIAHTEHPPAIVIGGADDKLHCYVSERVWRDYITLSGYSQTASAIVSEVLHGILKTRKEISTPSNYVEIDISYIFPELGNVKKNVISLSIQEKDFFNRIWALGCQDGAVFICKKIGGVDIDPSHSVTRVSLDGPISSLSLFVAAEKHSYDNIHLDATISSSSGFPSDRSRNDVLYCTTEGDDITSKHLLSIGIPTIDLVVGSALGYSVVYRDVIRHGVRKPIFLPSSANYDAVSCVLVGHFAVDKEITPFIFLGTYGRALLVYQLVEDTYELLTTFFVSHPVFSICLNSRVHNITTLASQEKTENVFCKSADEMECSMVVLSHHGLHFISWDPEEWIKEKLIQEILEM